MAMIPRDRSVMDRDGNWHYFLDNKEVTQAAYEAVYPPPELGCPAGNPLKGWPMVNQALKVHPRRRQEAIDDAAKKGVPTEFTPAGDAIIRDRSHYRAYLKAYGFHMRNSYYGV